MLISFFPSSSLQASFFANFGGPDDARERNLLVEASVEYDLTNQYANGLIDDKSTDSHHSLCIGKLSRDLHRAANPKRMS